MWLLCLVCVTAPAWGSDEEDGGTAGATQEDVPAELGWEVDDDDKVWKEACPFAPGGELWRLSGTSSGSTISSGSELFALRRDGQTVLDFLQEGHWEFGGGAEVDESERWKVRCKPGLIDIVTPSAKVTLQAGETGLKLDPRSLQDLSPGSRKPGDAAVQSLIEVFAALDRAGARDSIPELREAFGRARLLSVERALASGNLDWARHSLALTSGMGILTPELGSWASDLNRRVEALYSKPPLMATEARRVGSIMSLPGRLHEDDNPILFWRGTQLCVRQEESTPPRMRCVEARTGQWGKEESYSSPFEGWRVELRYLGGAGYYQTRALSIGPDGAENEYGEWSDPVVVARGQGGVLVVVSANDPRKNGEMEDVGLASKPGSLLAGRGRYFFSQPDELRSLEAVGRAWKFVIPGPQGELRCKAHPRVSPNGRWAACPVEEAAATGTADAGPSSRYGLFLFGLAPSAH
jgi:hypothetical protein